MSQQASAFDLTSIKRPEQQPAGTRAFTILLFAVFFVVLMASLTAGVSVYKGVVERQNAANDTRIAAALIGNSVRANDGSGALSGGDGPEGRALVLKGGTADTPVETRIYLFEGNIVQEYTLAGNAYDPASAEVLFASDTFEFTFDGNLLSVTTDQGTSSVALRSTNPEEILDMYVALSGATSEETPDSAGAGLTPAPTEATPVDAAPATEAIADEPLAEGGAQ